MPYEKAPQHAADLLMTMLEEHHEDLADLHIDLLLAPDRVVVSRREVCARVCLAGPREHDLQGVDAYIILNRPWWEKDGDPEDTSTDDAFARRTLTFSRVLDHCLCEIQVTEKGGVVLVYAPAEFAEVIERWGVEEGSELEEIGHAFVRRYQAQLPGLDEEEDDRGVDPDAEGYTMTISSGGKTVEGLTLGDLERAATQLEREPATG